MNNLPFDLRGSPSREPVKIDIEPTSFAAISRSPFAIGVGKLTLEVDREGFRLLNKRGIVSETLWIELEEFENEVLERGEFSFRGTIAGSDVVAVIRVGLSERADYERLAAIFSRLPAEVSGRTCPACGGLVLSHRCENCGKSFAGQQRRKGLKLIVIGGVVLLLGILLTYAVYNPQSETMLVFLGPILIGALLIIVGLIGLVFGKRV